MGKIYTPDEYKELVEKVAQGNATPEEIKDAESLILKATEEIDSILINNENK